MASKTKTATTRLDSIKDPDAWPELCDALGLSDEVRDAHFEFGEYATIEIEVTPDLRIVGGRIVPKSQT
mgnify:CR=1 FL=1